MSGLQLSHSSQPYAQMPSPIKLAKFTPSQSSLPSKSVQFHQNDINTSIAPLSHHFKLSLAENGENSISQPPAKKRVTLRPYFNKKAQNNIFITIFSTIFWALKEFLRTIFQTILFGGLSLIVIFIAQILKTLVKTTTNIFWTVILNILSLFPGKSLPSRFWSLKKISYLKRNHEMGHDKFTKSKYHRSEVKTTKPLTLVLDLDETLIHATRSAPIHGDFETLKILKINGDYQQIYLRKRPHLSDFLEKISIEFNVIVFTASRQEYADVILDLLDSKNVISKRFYRESCIKTASGFLKDLTIIEPNLSRVILLDNSFVAGSLQPENYLPIKSWFHDETDQALHFYSTFLLECARKWKADLSSVKDIRRHLKEALYQGRHHVNTEKAPAN